MTTKPESNPTEKRDQIDEVRSFLYGTMAMVDAAIDQVARRSTPMTPKK
jgi:DNA-binding MltR family transcriptional regulator